MVDSTNPERVAVVYCDFHADGDVLQCVACGRRVRTKSRGRVLATCRAFKPMPVAGSANRPQRGPGTELKKLLAGWPLYIKSTANCSCNRHAAQMDAWGPEGCAANLETIVGWLREEAAKRKLPFIDAVGTMIVRRAIRNARRTVAS